MIGPTVHTKTSIFTYFHSQFLVLFTMVPRNRNQGYICPELDHDIGIWSLPVPSHAWRRRKGVYSSSADTKEASLTNYCKTKRAQRLARTNGHILYLVYIYSAVYHQLHTNERTNEQSHGQNEHTLIYWLHVCRSKKNTTNRMNPYYMNVVIMYSTRARAATTKRKRI